MNNKKRGFESNRKDLTVYNEKQKQKWSRLFSELHSKFVNRKINAKNCPKQFLDICYFANEMNDKDTRVESNYESWQKLPVNQSAPLFINIISGDFLKKCLKKTSEELRNEFGKFI